MTASVTPTTFAHRSYSAGLKHLVFAGLMFCMAYCPSALAAEDILRSLEGPDITIIADDDRTVYEYRQNGLLRIVKIIPSFGRPYYLVPADETRGFGNLDEAPTLLPRWVIIEF